MTDERVHALDAEALELFARKGREGGPNIAQSGPANGVKVRRVMQVTRDLAGRPFSELRILDLGCGEGVYAIEAGLRGARVTALDARTQRMAQGEACAKRHGLANVTFVEEDVRRVSRERLGAFDVVYFLGLLYHLDGPDVFPVLESVFALSSRLLIVDTLISLTGESAVVRDGREYRGRFVREHEDSDPPEVRRAKVLKSIDNALSFRFTRSALLAALHDVGFTSVYDCGVPLEPGKAEDRITLAAVKGTPVVLSTYPWVNGLTEPEIARALEKGDGS